MNASRLLNTLARMLVTGAALGALSCRKASYLESDVALEDGKVTGWGGIRRRLSGKESDVALENGKVTARESGHWYLVQEHPPTMFPVGYPQEGKTEAADGEWIEGGAGVRWFVPRQGANRVSQRQLTSEALAMRSKLQKQKLAREEAWFATKALFAQFLVGLASLPPQMPAYSQSRSSKDSKKSKKSKR